MATEPEVVVIGGISLRFVNGMLQRQFVAGGRWEHASYTTVAPRDADAYAAFCARNLAVSRTTGERGYWAKHQDGERYWHARCATPTRGPDHIHRPRSTDPGD